MQDLTKGKEASVLISFAIPMLLGNVFQQLYTLADGFLVGQFIGDSALAAVGASFPVIFFGIALMNGISIGSSIMVSQFFGAGKKDQLPLIGSTTLIASVVLGFILLIVGFLFIEPLFIALKTPSDVLPRAVEYMKIIFCGMIFQSIFNAVTGILRGVGDSKMHLIFLIITTILYIGLDILFVPVFHWGIAGAAWATNISIAIAAILSFFYMQSIGDGLLKTFSSKKNFSQEIFVRMMKIGLPAGIQQSLVSLGFLALNRIVNPYGTAVLAGYTAASRLDSFASLPAMNLSMALSGFVGQNLGAGKPERVKKGFRAAMSIGMVLSVITALVMIIFAKPLIGFFNSGEEVIRAGSLYLIIVPIFYPFFTAMFITGGVLRGAGDTVVQMLITLLALWVIRIPCSAFFSTIWGEAGIWWGIPAGWIIGSIANTIYYLGGHWKRNYVVKIVVPE